MRFDSHHKVILDSLTGLEAEGLLEFLIEERTRHVKCIEEALLGKFNRPLVAPIYESAIVRHQEDMVSINAKILEVKEKINEHVSLSRSTSKDY